MLLFAPRKYYNIELIRWKIRRERQYEKIDFIYNKYCYDKYES